LVAAGRDGGDVLPALFGQAERSRGHSLVLQGIGNVLALRDRDWKYISANRDMAAGIGWGVDSRDRRFSDAQVETDLHFNLAQDPGETRNLSDTHQEKLAERRARLVAIR